MPDDVTLSDGLGGTIIQSTDLLDDGSHAVEIKVLQSAPTDGSRWLIDSAGALVNLGTNNDVTLTSGTLTAIAGTVTTSIAGTPTVAISGGTTTFSGALSAGTALIGYVGLSANGTAIADILSLTNGTAVAVGLYNTSGVQLDFPDPVVFAFTVTNGTAAYTNGDTMGTANTHSAASRGAGKTGHIVSAVCTDPGAEGGTVYLHVFDSAVVPSADNAAYTLLGGTDLGKAQGVITFSDWYSAGTAGYIGIGKLSPVGHPLHYATAGGSALTSVAVSGGTGVYGGTSLAFELHAILD